jgi:tetratricopeptide (TPR) repeat protein
MSIVKDELDALQIDMAEERRPWWKQAATWISVAALLATIYTAQAQIDLGQTQVDLGQTQGLLQTRQEAIGAEAELSNVLAHVAEAEREKTKALKGLEADDPQRGQIEAFYRAQLLTWAYKASEIVDDRPEETTGAEYYLLGHVFKTQLGPVEQALTYFRKAMENAEDVRTFVFAAQVLGEQYFARGEIENAEEVFRQAVSPPERLMRTQTRAFVLDDIFYTRLVWIGQLRLKNLCHERKVLIKEAQEDIAIMKRLDYVSFSIASFRREKGYECVAEA